jgi:hypothetical protein
MSPLTYLGSLVGTSSYSAVAAVVVVAAAVAASVVAEKSSPAVVVPPLDSEPWWEVPENPGSSLGFLEVGGLMKGLPHFVQ